MRLGVALLVPPPFDVEVDAFRRALGDGALGRIPAHLTLVPPVNVAERRLGEALAVVRAAAAASRPFAVAMGAPATFWPDNPVIYLRVEEGRGDVVALRDRVFVGPLARPLTWPFVPHVTVADEAAPERIAAAKVALADYRASFEFDRIHVLRQGDDRRWTTIAEAVLGPVAVIGRGGLPVTLCVTSRSDPETQPLLAESEAQAKVVTARRNGAVAGVAAVALAPGEETLGTAEHLATALRNAVINR